MAQSIERLDRNYQQEQDSRYYEENSLEEKELIRQRNQEIKDRANPPERKHQVVKEEKKTAVDELADMLRNTHINRDMDTSEDRTYGPAPMDTSEDPSYGPAPMDIDINKVREDMKHTERFIALLNNGKLEEAKNLSYTHPIVLKLSLEYLYDFFIKFIREPNRSMYLLEANPYILKRLNTDNQLSHFYLLLLSTNPKNRLDILRLSSILSIRREIIEFAFLTCIDRGYYEIAIDIARIYPDIRDLIKEKLDRVFYNALESKNTKRLLETLQLDPSIEQVLSKVDREELEALLGGSL